MIETGKKVIYSVWVCCLLILLGLYITRPGFFSPGTLIGFLERFESEILLTYILLTFVRGFFLVPSTPFVIGGAILFPDRLFMVLLISMAGVLFSTTCIYYFSDLLGFSRYLEKRFPEMTEIWKRRLQHPQALAVVTGWALFPLVPTDLISYVGGIIKMPFRYVFTGVLAGELTLNIFYVYAGSSLFHYITG